MKNARALIAKIETTLNTDIAEAAAKRDLNKMVLALTESVKDLVAVTKDMADVLDAISVTDTGVHITGDLTASGNVTCLLLNPAKPVKTKAKAAAKAAPKRVQKQPIAPK